MKKFLKKFWNLYKKIPCCLSTGFFYMILALIYLQPLIILFGWILAVGMLIIDGMIGYFRAAHEIAKAAREAAQMKPKNAQEAIQQQTTLLSAAWFFRGHRR